MRPNIRKASTLVDTLLIALFNILSLLGTSPYMPWLVRFDLVDIASCGKSEDRPSDLLPSDAFQINLLKGNHFVCT